MNSTNKIILREGFTESKNIRSSSGRTVSSFGSYSEESDAPTSLHAADNQNTGFHRVSYVVPIILWFSFYIS